MNYIALLFPGVSAAAAFFFAYGVSAWVWELRDPTRRGLEKLTERELEEPGLLMRGYLRLASTGERFLPVLGSERARIEALLYLGGFRGASAPAVFLAAKVLLVLVVPVVIWMALRPLPQIDQWQLWSLSAIGLILAMLLPNWWLERRVQRRQARLRNGFPDALDMLVICVEAGLGLTAAIERVTNEIRMLHPELATELAAVSAEMRSGVDRTTALQSLNDRTGLPEIRGLVSLLVQTLQLGTGVADSLRIYSAEFRDRRMQAAEERAAKIGTKMIFPLVLCLLPAFFVVAIGPAALRILDAFST